jgi:hypothetical protein
VMLTNEQVPMYLVNTERPKNPSENQFFMMSMERANTVINSNIKNELCDRAGWYIRTELRARYEDLKARGVFKANRYSIPVPITPFLEHQYANARTSLDYECDSIFLACINGIQKKDRLGNLQETIGPFDTLSTEDLRKIISASDLKNSNVKSFRERMQTHGYLSKVMTRKNGLDAWKVITSAIIDVGKPQQKGN